MILNSIFSEGGRNNILLKEQINGFNWKQCSNIYQGISIDLSNEQMCASREDNSGSCVGDSGDWSDAHIEINIHNETV